MKKKSYAAMAVALVTGGLTAQMTKAGLTGVQNPSFEYDLANRTPTYTYGNTIAGWYKTTGNVFAGYYHNGTGWYSQSQAALANGDGNAYANLQGDGTNPGGIFQSIGTFTPNYSISVNLLEGYIAGATGHNLIVSLYSGGSSVVTTTPFAGYAQQYLNHNLSGSTLIGTQTIADDGINSFNASSLTFNTGTAGATGSTLWLKISTDATDNTQLAVDKVVLNAATVYNPLVYTGAISNTWDTSTANFSNASGGVAFTNGADAIFNDIAAGKSAIALSGTVMPGTITFNNSSSAYTVGGSGSIAGGTSLTKLGTSSLAISATNSFTGPVSINAGTLILQNGAALGTSQAVTVASGAVLELQTSSGVSTTFNNNFYLNGAGSSGQGALVNLSGSNTIAGTADLATGQATINVSAGKLTFTGSVYGTGGLTKTGAGELDLDGYGNYFGDVNLVAGSLSPTYTTLGGNNVNVSGGATLLLATAFADGAHNLNIFPGGITQASGGDAIGYGSNRVFNVNIIGGVFNTADNQNEGFDTNWNLTGGSMTSTGGGGFQFDVAGPSSITSNSNKSTSVVSGPINLRDDSGSGNLVITVASGAANGIDLLLSGKITGGADTGLDKEGPGTLDITAATTFSGGITVGGGTLMFGDGTAAHDGSLSASNTITNNAAVVFNTGSSQTFGGNFSGSGTLTKTGAGTLVLTGSGNADGGINVSAGKLYVNSGQISSNAGVNVLSGATLGGTGSIGSAVTVASGGSLEAGMGGTGQFTVFALAFNGSAGISVGALSNYAGTAAIRVSSVLAATSANSVTFNLTNLSGVTAGSTYELIAYGSESGPGASAYKVSLPRGDSGSIVDTGNQIDVTINSLSSGGYALLWTGANPTAGWDTVTPNWKYNGVTTTTYIEGDPVVFDDTPGSNQTVLINAADVHPASVTFNNSTYSYTVSGAHGISGSAGVTLNGLGKVTLSTTNSFTGPVVINAGNLSVSSDANLGAAPTVSSDTVVLNSGTLSFTASTSLNANRSIAFNGSGGTIDVGTSTVAVNGAIDGTGNVIVNSTGSGGTLQLNANTDTNTAALLINGGTVDIGAVGSNHSATSQNFSTINVSSGATLVFTATNTFGYGGAGAYKPPIVINGGTVTNTNTDNYIGGQITMTGGTINGLDDFRLQAYTTVSSSALLTTNAAATTATITVPSLVIYSPTIFTVAKGSVPSGVDLSISSNISQASSTNSLAKAGTGVLSLTGSDSYGGGTVVNAGTLTFAGPYALPTLSALTIGNGGLAVAANHSSGVAKNDLVTSSFSIAGSTGAWTGKLDLTNNDMIDRGGSLATITNQVQQGFNNGTWNGSGGIVSSAAAASTRHLTALGVISNDNGSGTALYGSGGTLAATFDGYSTIDGDVLVKYTYYGDTNLDGKVDGTDYSRIDSSFLQEKTAGSISGWFNGDFNYDGVINGSDYTLIDNAFNSQGAVISAAIAGPTAVATAQIASGSGTSAVPEPATFGLVGIGVIGMLGRRKRRVLSV